MNINHSLVDNSIVKGFIPSFRAFNGRFFRGYCKVCLVEWIKFFR